MNKYDVLAQQMSDKELGEELDRTRIMLKKYVELASGAIGSVKNPDAFQADRHRLCKRYNAYQAEYDKRQSIK